MRRGIGFGAGGRRGSGHVVFRDRGAEDGPGTRSSTGAAAAGSGKTGSGQRTAERKSGRPIMRRLMTATLLVFLLALAVPALAGDGTTPAAAAVSYDDHGDPVLKAMIAELKRSQ